MEKINETKSWAFKINKIDKSPGRLHSKKQMTQRINISNERGNMNSGTKDIKRLINIVNKFMPINTNIKWTNVFKDKLTNTRRKR